MFIAILLDAGFLRCKLGTARSPMDAARVSAFVEQLIALPCVSGMRLHRVYFYDAKPLEGVSAIPLGGRVIDFGTSSTAIRNKRLHSDLSREPFFALRYGELFHGGWRLKKRVLRTTGLESKSNPLILNRKFVRREWICESAWILRA